MFNNPEPPINPPEELRGDHVVLRTTREQEIPILHAWGDDPEVSQYVDDNRPSLERHLEIFHNMQIFRNFWQSSIYLSANDELIGDCYLNILKGRVSAGIVIGKKDEWRKGYGEEAMRLLIDFSRSLPVSHMELVVANLNVKARKLYEKLGFCVSNRPLRDSEMPLGEGNTRMELPL